MLQNNIIINKIVKPYNADPKIPISNIKENKQITFEEWMKDRRYAENTIYAYKYRLKEFLNNYDITEEGILGYLRKKKFTISAIHFIKIFLEYRGKPELINIIPKKRGTAQLSKKRSKGLSYLTQDQVKTLLNYLIRTGQSHIAIAVQFLYIYGLRISELVNLDKTSFNFDTKNLVILGKRNKVREIPMTEHHCKLMIEFCKHLRPDDKVFAFKNYKPNTKSLSLYYQRHLKQAGKVALPNVESVHPHMMRHSCGTMLRHKGADLVEIQELLGHADISTTRIYTDIVNKESLRKRTTTLEEGLK